MKCESRTVDQAATYRSVIVTIGNLMDQRQLEFGHMDHLALVELPIGLP